MMRGKRFRWWWLVLLIPILAVVGYGIWAQVQHKPMPEALAALSET